MEKNKDNKEDIIWEKEREISLWYIGLIIGIVLFFVTIPTGILPIVFGVWIGYSLSRVMKLNKEINALKGE